MNEKTLQTKFLKWLKEKKIYYIKTMVVSKAGCPDVIALISGQFVAFEIKGTGGKLSALQVYNADKIKMSGGAWFEVNPKNIKLVKMLVLKKIQTGTFD
jgi:hypothetical protein